MLNDFMGDNVLSTLQNQTDADIEGTVGFVGAPTPSIQQLLAIRPDTIDTNVYDSVPISQTALNTLVPVSQTSDESVIVKNPKNNDTMLCLGIVVGLIALYFVLR
jgi:hypothetical protein